MRDDNGTPGVNNLHPSFHRSDSLTENVCKKQAEIRER